MSAGRANRQTSAPMASAFIRFVYETDGRALLETVIIVPVIFLFLAGILEFGTLLFNKLELETGLSDAARYLARCQDYVTGTSTYGCTVAKAKNIALYGTEAPPTGSKTRVFGLTSTGITIASTVSGSPNSTFSGKSGNTLLYSGGQTVYVIHVGADFNYPGGPFLKLIGLTSIHMTAFDEERVIGW